MKIYVNARFLTQPISGVQRYGIECSLQIKKLYPGCVFLTPGNIFHTSIANELDAQVVGAATGHRWEQIDLPGYLRKLGSPPLFNPANTAPLLYKNNFVTLHDLAFYFYPQWNHWLFSRWYNFMAPRIVKKAQHLFTVSQTVRDEITANYHTPSQKISVTYNGISRDMLADGYTGQQKQPIILSVGTFNIRKNHHTLIKAFAASKLKRTHKLVIVGDGNKVFREAGLDESMLADNNIELIYQPDNPTLRELYKKAEIVVSLSVYEGFGIPVLEGLYYGCKAVCSDIPVYNELFGGYASFCDPANLEDIEKALQHAATKNPVDARDLLTRFSYERSAKTVLEKILK